MKIDLPPDRPQTTVSLPDGAVALLSPLEANDGVFLVEGLDEMSLESRYNRFGYGRAGLTRGELEYLSAVDQRNHVAWGAAVNGEGAGVGRYILTSEPHCAEVAVTVIDRFQRRGVGRLLFTALVAVARADGIEELCFEVAPDNVGARRMIRGLDVELDPSGSVLLGRARVSDIPASPLQERLASVMDAVRG